MSKNTNLSFLTDYITADITNGRIGINNASPSYAFDVNGTMRTSGATYLATASGNVGIGTTTTEGVLTIKGTSAQPPTSGTTANSLLQLVGSLGAELNIGSNTVTGGYGSYIQASDNNLAVPYPLNLQPNGGSVGIGNSNGTVGTLNVTGRIALTSSLFFSSNLTSEDRWEINVVTPANDLYFSRSGVGERMRIFSNGNVAIGTSTDNGYKLYVLGTIGTSGNISGANINGSSFSMNFGSTFNYGTGYLKSSTNGITVSTSTTTIYTSTNIGGVLSGNLVVVTGVRSGNGVNFTDLILYMNSGSISVISSQVFGSPPARSYSVSNENLNLSMASGTYVVACVALIQGYTNP
jgi:hypothetical protein